MPSTNGTNRPARTLLEQLIHERNQTLEEFAAYAETFAQEHGEPGTLSAGHLQRLVAGRRYDGRPLGRLRPATARLLEQILGVGIVELLSPPDLTRQDDAVASELSSRLCASERVDASVVSLLYEQLAAIRRLDRQLGASIAHDEVKVKVAQVEKLFSFSLSLNVRKRLAALLAEFSMLAGWQALDLGNITESWRHYECAKAAAVESGSEIFEAHASAQQAFVLLDIGKEVEAAELLASARSKASNTSPALLRSWLAAAHGETLAANGARSACLRAFDYALNLLPTEPDVRDGPYVVLDSVHLSRWHGHALARIGFSDAVPTLYGVLERIDPTFVRAETMLRVDLASALVKINELGEAGEQARHALLLAGSIGSKRQELRARSLIKIL